MKRVDTTTASVDENGPGKDGFTNGVPGSIPATEVDDTWLNTVQEELCTIVERRDRVLSASDKDQIEKIVSEIGRGQTEFSVIEGMHYSATGLSATIQSGAFIFEGRRYDTSPTLLSGVANTTLTLTGNAEHFVGIRPVGGDTSVNTLEISVSNTDWPAGYTRIWYARTNSSVVTHEARQESLYGGSQIDYRSAKTQVLTTLQSIGDAGAASVAPLASGNYRRSYILETQTSGASDVVRVPMGPYGLMQEDTGATYDWPNDLWPDGTRVSFEVTVHAAHKSETDVSLTKKLMMSAYVHSGTIISAGAAWTSLYSVLSTQATSDGLTTNSAGADSNGFYLEVDSGAGSTGQIRWTFFVDLCVTFSQPRPILMGDPTNFA